MFFKPLPKCSSCLSYVLLITLQPVTFVSVNYTTFLGNVFFIFRCHLQTRVYRKPTHTNQYLQWDSHHAMSNKYSVISSLLHRAKHICSSKELLEEEQMQIQEALSTCKYPAWAINRMKVKTSTP